jgi:hypothetical protein
MEDATFVFKRKDTRWTPGKKTRNKYKGRRTPGRYYVKGHPIDLQEGYKTPN